MMVAGKALHRNIRPAVAEDEIDEDLASEAESDVVSTHAASDELSQDDEEESTSSSHASVVDDIDAKQQISNLSFSALKEAQDTLSRKRKREQDTSAEQEEKLSLLRQRLQRIKKEKADVSSKSGSTQARRTKNAQNGDIHQDDAESSSEESSGQSSEDETEQRRSKHAPAMQSTKHQVTRKRQVVDVPKRITRDPRFDAVRQRVPNTSGNEEKAYGFLRDYQKTEMQELKTAMKATTSEEDKQTLRRKLNSMENQAKAREAKEREREVIRKHRQQEGEQVRQGKTPYFLKKGEIKERALVEKFQSMKGKDREKLLERRRLKESQKEKKRMPDSRGAAGRRA